MVIEFQDGTRIGIELIDSPLRQTLVDIYHHLQHIEIPFNFGDRPISDNQDKKELVDLLATHAQRLAIIVDKERCLVGDQSYFNHLHAIYEKNYDGRREWLDYHESIHLCEFNKNKPVLNIDFRELAGMLERPFDRKWSRHAVMKVKAGDVFCEWSELGKTPYGYWVDKEPDEPARICELVKPWLKFRPHLRVAVRDIEFSKNHNLSDFDVWWQPYQKHWCAHYGLEDWDWKEMFSVIPVGRINDLDGLLALIDAQIPPSFVVMESLQTKYETLQVDLIITALWQSHAPSFDIWIDDTQIPIAGLRQGQNQLQFKIEIAPGPHRLMIERTGATPLDPQQMVVIDHLSMGKINCDKLIIANSNFRPCYPEPWATEQKQRGIELLDLVPFETVLGHNGTWTLDFESPFYPFLLRTNP